VPLRPGAHDRPPCVEARVRVPATEPVTLGVSSLPGGDGALHGLTLDLAALRLLTPLSRAVLALAITVASLVE
jgi:hypothetical protein